MGISLLFSLFFISIGIIMIYRAVKNRHVGVVPRKLIARLIRELLGDKGTKVFVIVFGSIFVLIGLSSLLGSLFYTSSKKTGFEKTEKITVQLEIQGIDNAPALGIMLFKNIDELERKREKYSTIRKISFKNNHLDSLPLCLLEMNNLNELDLRGNNVTVNDLLGVLKAENDIKKLKVFGTPLVKDDSLLLNQFPSIEIDTSRADEAWY